MPARQNKPTMISEARAWIMLFKGCAGCTGKAVIVNGRQSRVRILHAKGCRIEFDIRHNHPMIYKRDMGYQGR